MSLRLERQGKVARLLLDRPAKRNAMSQAMWLAMPGLVRQAVDDPAVQLILVTSAARGMFCAGADVAELMAQRGDAAWLAANQAAINAAQHALARAPKPTIAFIDGDCVGGGCAIALACDMRVAAPQARLGITPARLGLVYPLHDTALLVDLVGPGQARRMMYTGELLDAPEALRIGLVEMIGESADALIGAILAGSGYSQRAIKGFVRRALDGQVADDAETLRIFAEAFAGPDFKEGAAAFLARRKPDFP